MGFKYYRNLLIISLFLWVVLIHSAAAKSLYVDISDATCDNAHTRAENNESEPWCDLRGFVDDSTPSTYVLQSGDIVYIKPGDYNNEQNYLWMDTLTDDIIITAYPGTEHQANITHHAENYDTAPNSLWACAWNGTDSVCNTTFIYNHVDEGRLYFEDGTKCISDKYNEYDDLSGFWTSQADYCRSKFNDSSNIIQVRMPGNASFNASEIPLFLATDYATLRIHNLNGAGKLIIANLSFRWGNRHIYIKNSSNIVLEDNKFYGGYEAVKIIGGWTNHNNLVIQDNYFYGDFNPAWHIGSLKQNWDETAVISNDGGVLENITVTNNYIKSWGGGITLKSTGQNNVKDSTITYNYITDGAGSQLEIEDYCDNTTWAYNTILNSSFGISLGSAQAEAANPCYIHHNTIVTNVNQTWDLTNNYPSYAIKMYRAENGDPDISYFNIHHNTIIAEGQTIYGLTDQSWRLNDTNNLNITNNIFYSRNGYAVEAVGSGANNNILNHNVYYTGGDYVFYKYTDDSNTAKYNTLAEVYASPYYTNWDTNSFVTDPLFYSMASLQPYRDSPACGAATDGGDIGAKPCLLISYYAASRITESGQQGMQTFANFLPILAIIITLSVTVVTLTRGSFDGEDLTRNITTIAVVAVIVTVLALVMAGL